MTLSAGPSILRAMKLVDEKTVMNYLRDAGQIGTAEQVMVSELPGGVSNQVLLVRRPEAGDQDLVVKQARRRLRVAADWYCDVERIWREVEVLRVCQRLLQNQDGVTVQVPSVIYTDPDNYLYVMTVVPDHQTWKEQLLAGRIEPDTATACGRLLGVLHAETWRDQRLAEQLGDRRYFDDLRLDPYYREVSRVYDDLRNSLDRLMDSLVANPLALVHGDFSPKNLLVSRDRLALVDFEVGHFGDPAFDGGFFLSHLVLKAIRAEADFDSYLSLASEFERAYQERMRESISSRDLAALQQRAVRHAAACVLARIDGKSQVDYLDETQRQRSRRIARDLLRDPPVSWAEMREQIRDTLAPAGAPSRAEP